MSCRRGSLAPTKVERADSPEGGQEEGQRVQGDQRLQAEGCQCQRLPESDRPHHRGQHADREH